MSATAHNFQQIINTFEHQDVDTLVEDYDPSSLIKLLTLLDDQHFNGADHNLNCPDPIYDAIKNIAQRLEPHNQYFTGIGSEIRGEKIKLPYPMPSLNQVEVGDIEEWVNKHDLHENFVVASDKMDGTSLMIIYNHKGDLQIAYSRGDGFEGADVTRHIRKATNVPKKTTGTLVVRCEVELKDHDFEYLKHHVLNRSGQPYKTPRNMVAGIMNAKDNPDIIYDYLNVIAYQIITTPQSSDPNTKTQDFKRLTNLGFSIPEHKAFKGKELTDDVLADYLNERKHNSEFAIDGLVLDVDPHHISINLDRDVTKGDNPNSSVKYKVTDAENQHIATCKDVEWNISKHGIFKPRVIFEPFDLLGVTITHATAFNAKFVVDNGIGPGSRVKIVRSGEVIPYIQEVIEQATPAMPNQDYVWNETGVDIYSPNLDDDEEVHKQQLIDFCASMDFPHIRDKNIRTLFEKAGMTTPEDLLNAKLHTLIIHLGANGEKAYNGIHSKLNGIKISDLMGSSPCFGRGMGKRKFKNLIEQIGDDFHNWSKDQIVEAEGFDHKTADVILEGMPRFVEFYNNIKHLITQDTTDDSDGPYKGYQICLTGFRDKNLSDLIEQMGGKVQNSVTSKTDILVCSSVHDKSTKIQKAQQINESQKGNIEIVDVETFRDQIHRH